MDDAYLGIDPKSQSRVAMGIKAGLSVHDWAAVGVAVSVRAAGVMTVVSGGMTAIAILTRRRRPTIQTGSSSFKISWE